MTIQQIIASEIQKHGCITVRFVYKNKNRIAQVGIDLKPWLKGKEHYGNWGITEPGGFFVNHKGQKYLQCVEENKIKRFCFDKISDFKVA